MTEIAVAARARELTFLHKEWWTVNEVAAYLNLNPKTVRNWRTKNKIKGQYMNLKSESCRRPPYRFRRDEIMKILPR